VHIQDLKLLESIFWLLVTSGKRLKNILLISIAYQQRKWSVHISGAVAAVHEDLLFHRHWCVWGSRERISGLSFTKLCYLNWTDYI